MSTDGVVRCGAALTAPCRYRSAVAAQTLPGSAVSFGQVLIHDPATYRVGESSFGCVVTVQGFVCPNTASPRGMPGAVVTGGEIQDYAPNVGCMPSPTKECWLEGNGTASCMTCDPLTGQSRPQTVFAPNQVVFFSSNYFRDNLCAVYGHGSLCVVGTNQGRAGSSGEATHFRSTTPVMVQPPGSVRVGCQG